MNLEPLRELDVDALAQEIRRVDGEHKLGAAALAEALMPYLSRALAKLDDGWVLVPRSLTAENGAKAALSGEFHETIECACSECDEDYDCEVCEGSGFMDREVPVSWSTIKEIHKAMVAHFRPLPSPPAQVKP